MALAAPPDPYQAFGPQPDPALTIRQIESMGASVLWRSAVPCPNRIDIDDHDLNCTVCDRTGFYYAPGVAKKMLVLGVSLRQNYQAFGRIDAGTAYFTAMPEDALCWWDTVTLTNSIIPFMQVVKRGSTAAEKLRYKIVDSTAVNGVLYVIGSDKTIYTKGAHFTVVDGELTWLAGQGPDAGEFYSIRYFARPVYRILDVNHHVRDLPSYGPNGIAPRGVERPIRFPIQAIGRLEYLIREEGAAEL